MPDRNAISVSPHLIARDAATALDFYKRVFEAEELFRMTDPGDGRLGHAEIRIGDSVVMLADEYPDFGALSPDSVGGSPVLLHVQCRDADALMARAAAAGATVLRPAANQSFGERIGQFADPFGHRWSVSQKIETVAPDEMQRRWEAETGV